MRVDGVDEYLLSISRLAHYDIQAGHILAFAIRVEHRAIHPGNQSLRAKAAVIKLVNEISRRHKHSVPACLHDPSGPAIHHVRDRAHGYDIVADRKSTRLNSSHS